MIGLDALDLLALYTRYVVDSRRWQPYESTVPVKLLIYAYARATFSWRKAAWQLEEDVAFRVLAAGNFPLHRRLREFRRVLVGEFSALFLQIVKLAREAGFVQLGPIGMDGTEVNTNASPHKAMSYERSGRPVCEDSLCMSFGCCRWFGCSRAVSFGSRWIWLDLLRYTHRSALSYSSTGSWTISPATYRAVHKGRALEDALVAARSETPTLRSGSRYVCACAAGALLHVVLTSPRNHYTLRLSVPTRPFGWAGSKGNPV